MRAEALKAWYPWYVQNLKAWYVQNWWEGGGVDKSSVRIELRNELKIFLSAE